MSGVLASLQRSVAAKEPDSLVYGEATGYFVAPYSVFCDHEKMTCNKEIVWSEI